MDWERYLEVIKHNPVIVVMLGGLLGGSAFTQTIKILYLAFANGSRVGVTRYRASCFVLASLSTFFITNRLWELFIGDTGTGLRHIASFIVAVLCPYLYKLTKIVIAWKFPALAARFGDDHAGP